MIVGSIFDYQGEEFDLVTTCHVLEHLVDLPAFLLRLWSLIGERGILYVEVPNAADFSRFANPAGPGERIYIRDLYTHFTPEHVNFFSPASLRNLMTRFGFEEVSCSADPLAVIGSVWKCRPFATDSNTESEVSELRHSIPETPAGRSSENSAAGRIRETDSSLGSRANTQRLLGSGELDKANIAAFIDGDPSYQGNAVGRLTHHCAR